MNVTAHFECCRQCDATSSSRERRDCYKACAATAALSLAGEDKRRWRKYRHAVANVSRHLNGPRKNNNRVRYWLNVTARWSHFLA